MMETAAIRGEDPSFAEEILLGIYETIGAWPLLGLVAVGALTIFRKRIKQWIRDYLGDKK